MMTKIYFVLLGIFLSIHSFSQGTSVSGQVTDEESGTPLTGVSIQEKGEDNFVFTDKNGDYTLELKTTEPTLVYRFIGFETAYKNVKSDLKIDVALRPTTSKINNVVITALGEKRDERNLGYAIQKLETKEINEIKSDNFVNQLAGKIAGVTISQGASGVGSSSKITIRSEASFTNNNPLFVVDGVPINNNSILNFTNEAAAGFQEVDFGNGAMEINSDDIGSLSVLKGPAAAALYGTRASNGVIILNTKNGSGKKGIGVSFNSSAFVDRAFQLPEFQNRYGQGNSGQFEYVDGLGGGINDNITYSWGPELDQGIFLPQFDSPVALLDGSTVRGGDINVHGGAPITPTEFKSHPDNLKNFYKTGSTFINNIAISSGFDKGDIRLSFTDFKNNSIIPGVNLDRKNVAAKLNFKPNSKLRISSSINYVNSESDNRPSSGYGSENINYSLVAWGPRSLNIESLEDYWQPGLEDVSQYSFNYTFFDNPYFILFENRNSFRRDRIFGGISAAYDFTDNISLEARSGMDYSNEDRRFRRAFSSNRFSNGAYAVHNVFFREVNSDIRLKYKKAFENLSLNASIGGNKMDQQASTVQTQALSLAQPGIFTLSNAASPLEIFEFQSQKRINSLYALAQLGYKGFLYLDITARNDWSSALATPISAQNTSFFYPSISSGIIVSELTELPKAISFLKLRASWAQVGNDTDPYQTTSSFVAQTPYNSQPTFSSQDVIANANLLPEQTTSIEFGGDIRLFDNRIRLDATYYNSLTENQIIALPVPISSGYNQQVVNGGKVRSQGIEVMANFKIMDKEEFSWSANLNYSKNKAIVEELPEGVETLTLGYNRVYDNVNQTVWIQVEEGGQIGDLYGTGYLINENGDQVVNQEGKLVADNNLKKLGNYNPDFILAASNQFAYKNWDLGFLFDWRKGGILVSRTLSLAGVSGQLMETIDRPEDGFIIDGVYDANAGTEEPPEWIENTTSISAETYYRDFYNRNHEENNVYNASYLKLREFHIGYTFRPDQMKFLGDEGTLRVSFMGRNLFAISEIPHFDPEQSAVQGNQFLSGVEDMSYATARSYGLKLSLNF